MLTLEPGLYLRVQELANGPTPFPSRSGFSSDVAYRALGLYNPSETADAYFILANDRDEIWFISNRHLRCIGLLPSLLATRLPLAEAVDHLAAPRLSRPPRPGLPAPPSRRRTAPPARTNGRAGRPENGVRRPR